MRILLNRSCSEIRLRNEMVWAECDFGLLYNCNSRAGHYSAVKRFDETGVVAKQVKPGQDYSEREDTRVRFESDVPRGMVMVDESITVNELRGFSGLSCHLAPPFPPRPPLPPLSLHLPILPPKKINYFSSSTMD